jgi:hypothetical protein
MMDGMMTWHIDERRGFSSEGLGEDLSAAGSEGKSLQTVTTGPERQRQGGLRAARGERAWMIYDIVAS